MRVPRSSRPLALLADSEELAASWALGALVAFVVSAVGAGALAFILYQAIQITWLTALIGLVATIVAHEAVHVLGMRAVGGRPTMVWGFRRLVPYFHVASLTRLTRGQALVTMLTPLVLIDLIGLGLLLLPATSGVAVAVLVANTVGSVPDLWRAGQLLRFPAWIQCEHRGATILVWAPAEHDHAKVRIDARPPAAPPLVAVLGIWAVCLLVAEAVIAGAVRLAAQWDGALAVAGIRLASTEQFVSGPDVVLNFLPVIVAGAALGTLAAAAWMLVVPVPPRAGRQSAAAPRIS
jgi:hypothetical protein